MENQYFESLSVVLFVYRCEDFPKVIFSFSCWKTLSTLLVIDEKFLMKCISIYLELKLDFT